MSFRDVLIKAEKTLKKIPLQKIPKSTANDTPNQKCGENKMLGWREEVYLLNNYRQYYKRFINLLSWIQIHVGWAPQTDKHSQGTHRGERSEQIPQFIRLDIVLEQ